MGKFDFLIGSQDGKYVDKQAEFSGIVNTRVPERTRRIMKTCVVTGADSRYSAMMEVGGEYYR